MNDFFRLVEERRLKIGVIGLGYVGLPLAVEFGEAGFKVIGFEVSEKKIALIQKGENYIGDVKNDSLAKLVSGNYLSATSDFSKIAECDAISICVPTPLSKTQEPDISYILAATTEVTKYLKPGALVVLESTTYPGTTEEVMLPALASEDRKVGTDFFLAFSPERVDPGNPVFHTGNTPKVIGGTTADCMARAKFLYETVITKVVPVSSTTASEMVKLVENTFRAINIASVNEIAQICERLGLDVWEIIEAAATKPFGFVSFYPGPGLGGHCIPIDPLYLSWKMKSLDFRTRFIELASEINQSMPLWVVQRVTDILNDRSKSVKNTKILVLGVAYKRDVDDCRESPALDVMELLLRKGALVSYHDPYVTSCVVGEYSELPQHMSSIALTKEAIRDSELVLCTTDHSVFDWNFILEHADLVFDTRNGTNGITSDKVIKL